MRDYIDSLCQLTTGIDAVDASPDADRLFVFPNPGIRFYRDPFPATGLEPMRPSTTVRLNGGPTVLLERLRTTSTLLIFDVSGRDLLPSIGQSRFQVVGLESITGRQDHP